jgi:hypothetical protein
MTREHITGSVTISASYLIYLLRHSEICGLRHSMHPRYHSSSLPYVW